MMIRSAFFLSSIEIQVPLLIFIYLLAPVMTLNRKDLYPYTLSDVQILKFDSNGMIFTDEYQLQTPIVFFDREYKIIYVNGNGVLSFIRPMNRFFNIPFPLDDPAIAPLYTHVDIRGSGTIHYIETNTPQILSRAGSLIRKNFKNAYSFIPSHVFIVTWLNVGYFHEKKDKLNTYQVVISSNGTHSYVELLYPENGIQWIQGESHPNGLPDAKAQAGIIAEDKMYALTGSGTDQISNIDKLSNIQRPGQWIFQIGPIQEKQNIVLPDNATENYEYDQLQSCTNSGATHCHSKAICIDYEQGYCCECKQGYFGNGKSCQPNDIPLRVIGKVFGAINGQDFVDRDLQCYVQTKDGRTYTALARIPENIGNRFQLLNSISGIIGWLFAKTNGETRNGYQLTGGVFNHTTELYFKTTSDKVIISNRYLGLDVFGQLKMESEIRGTLPFVEEGDSIDYGDYEVLFTRIQTGIIRSSTERNYRLAGSPLFERQFTEDQIIYYNECSFASNSTEGETSKLKFSRGITAYETREGIIRFATNAKIMMLEEVDPCIQGKLTCSIHSSCIADGDSFRCICDPGYLQLYDEDSNSSCTDINECNVGKHTCSSNAYCFNTEGGYACRCKQGFTGNGHNCDKLTFCNKSQCEDYEQCIMINGKILCECAPGYENLGNGCIPIEQCNGYNCYFDSNIALLDKENPIPQCHIEICWCPLGWVFQNNMCLKEDTDESQHGSGELMHDHECREHKECDENERCSYIPVYSRYECTCQPGYKLLDGQCTIADCLTNPAQCHTNAQCVSVIEDLTEYRCVCMFGYRGDGIYQCVEEHIGCNDINNCGRNAVCGYNQTSNNYTCICLPGYFGDGYKCVEQTSCSQNSNLCSQNASCVHLGENEFVCLCNDGYIGDGIKCESHEKLKANFLLVNQGMATHRIPFMSTVDNPGNPIYVSYSQMTIALDIDCSKEKAYISDITGNKIISMSYNGSQTEVFVGKVSSPEGIAIDWVARAIFWTDSANETIEVANLDTKKRKILIKNDLVNPRGIAVHPYRGKIFWSDWNRASPKLEWANEDGTGRQIFLIGENVKLPNSLAIDWYSDELCWADAGIFSINCVNIDNKSVRIIIKNLSYPFGLAISRKYYYSTDWKTGKIEVVSKHIGENRSSIALPPGSNGKPYGIVVVPEICPKVSNICQYDNGRCTQEQLCLPDGKGGRTCTCADNADNPCTDFHYSS